MKECIAYLIKNLVDQPDAVDIQIVDGQDQMLIEVRVSAADIPKVIGKQGRIIKSLRTIAMTLGARLGRRVRLELVQ